jgi:hypothetical protein
MWCCVFVCCGLSVLWLGPDLGIHTVLLRLLSLLPHYFAMPCSAPCLVHCVNMHACFIQFPGSFSLAAHHLLCTAFQRTCLATRCGAVGSAFEGWFRLQEGMLAMMLGQACTTSSSGEILNPGADGCHQELACRQGSVPCCTPCARLAFACCCALVFDCYVRLCTALWELGSVKKGG